MKIVMFIVIIVTGGVRSEGASNEEKDVMTSLWLKEEHVVLGPLLLTWFKYLHPL